VEKLADSRLIGPHGAMIGDSSVVLQETVELTPGSGLRGAQGQ
jgi:hypothetical protein